jgi:hypothetical protein
MTFNIRRLTQITVAATVALSATAGAAKAEDYQGWDYANSSIKMASITTKLVVAPIPLNFMAWR